MSKEWRDQFGKALSDYPRPSVAADVALLTVDPGGDSLEALHVVVTRAPEGAEAEWALPGRFLRREQQLRDAAREALDEKTGVRGEEPQQLCVLDDPERDPRGWVLSVAHVDLVPFSRLDGALRHGAALARVLPDKTVQHRDRPIRLAFDHEQVLAKAVDWARRLYVGELDPRGLVEPRHFTLAQLRRVHEAVAGDLINKDTFRRRIEREGGVAESTEKGRQRGSTGAPARLYHWERRGRRRS